MHWQIVQRIANVSHNFMLRQVRSTGPINPLTKQPVKGRKAGDGITFRVR